MGDPSSFTWISLWSLRCSTVQEEKFFLSCQLDLVSRFSGELDLFRGIQYGEGGVHFIYNFPLDAKDSKYFD